MFLHWICVCMSVFLVLSSQMLWVSEDNKLTGWKLPASFFLLHFTFIASVLHKTEVTESFSGGKKINTCLKDKCYEAFACFNMHKFLLLLLYPPPFFFKKIFIPTCSTPKLMAYLSNTYLISGLILLEWRKTTWRSVLPGLINLRKCEILPEQLH